MSSRLCPRCQRPLPADAPGGPCPHCPAADPTRSAPGSDAPRVAELPLPPRFLSTRPGDDGTLTPAPGGSTVTHGESAPDARDYLPAAPPGYELVRQLGHGGMGSVFLAREHATERTVAIKFLHAPGSPAAYERFLVEVRALARLDHPNVVRVYAVETNWREPFFTMEYAAGGTLADLVADGRPPPDPAAAARLILAAAEGVAAAHAAGILHRDLKPSNVLLANAECGIRNAESGREGSGSGLHSEIRVPHSAFRPKVSDFGLAKRTDRDDGLTRSGPLGTPGYMSPEAAAGRFREVGPAADVYGLGATLYHLLTGRPPFTGPDPAEVLRRVMTDPPARPRAVRPGVPAGLEAVVVRALEKDPARRYATVEEFAADLRRFLAGQAPSAPVLTPWLRARRWLAHNRKRVAVVVAVGLTVAGLVVVGRMTGPPSRPDPEPPPVEPVVVVQPAPTPEQVAEAELARIKKALAAGDEVRLIGETGLPKYHRFLLEPNTLGLAPDGTCSFHAFDYCLLELAPDLGTDRYRVSLEIRHLQTRFPAPKGQIDTDAVGFYFGQAAHTATNRTTVHPLFAVTYQDYEAQVVSPDRPPDRFVRFRMMGLFQSADERRLAAQGQFASLKFDPPPARPDGARPVGEWRRVEADLSPEKVHVRWRDDKGKMQTLLNWPGDRARQEYENLKAALEKNAPGVRAAGPRWSPRMPFGVYSFRASVAVRKVTVTPLP